MTKTLLTALILFSFLNIKAQYISDLNKNINSLNSNIKLREAIYSKSEAQALKSIPQTTATYFELSVEKPEDFLLALSKAENFDKLPKLYPNLIVDRNLLIVKSNYENYKKVRQIEISSFNIGNGGAHQITLKFSDSLNSPAIRFFYTQYREKNATTLKGFYLKNNFISTDIPKIYADWVNYNDILLEPEKPIFLTKLDYSYRPENFKKTIIDTLKNYFDIQTKRPIYKTVGYDELTSKKIAHWRSKKKIFADSLYNNDNKFKLLLNDAFVYAEQHAKLDPDLEELAYFFLPKERLLDLVRMKQIVGYCSYDEGPTEQMRKIASLAAETSNWSIYIKATLNVLNDYAQRNANSNFASENRKTYVEDLKKLDINIHKLLLGSNLKISSNNKAHYFSDGSKIAQAYASLDEESQKTFLNIVEDVIKNPQIDSFNKLHFYNTLLSYKYFLKDISKASAIDKKIEQLIPFLPNEVKSRIENPNKQLTDLLHREKSLLSKFRIESSAMGSIYSHSYGGMCWKANLIEKNSQKKIIYDLTMPISFKITPLSNFTTRKDSLDNAIMQSKLLLKILNKDTNNKLHVEFTDNKSFTNHNGYATKDIPSELLLKLDFHNAISTYIIHSKYNYVRYILLKNNHILIITEPSNFNRSKSYQLFNENGELLYPKVF